MHDKNIDSYSIGKKMIEAAISLDESLVEILKIEIKRLKQLSKDKDVSTFTELQKTNNLIKNIIMSLMLTDEKIKTGINLCLNNFNDGHDK